MNKNRIRGISKASKAIRDKIINITSDKPLKISELSKVLEMNINNLRTRYVYRMIKDRVLKRERARYSPIKEIVIRND
jgi:CRISPR/Cas system CSM-associated protein Csm2 small subunit